MHRVRISVQLPNTDQANEYDLEFGDQSRRVLAALQNALREHGIPNNLENDHNSLEYTLKQQ